MKNKSPEPNRRLLLVPVLFLLAGSLYSDGTTEDGRNWLTVPYEELEISARSTQVSFFMWGGSAVINQWVDTYVADELDTRFGIQLRRNPMDASVFVNKLLTEKQAGKKTGTLDLLWINGENFKNAIEAGLLFGPFAGKLPNFKDYVDPETVEYDFGYPVKEYEAPYGRAQFVFEHDSARVPEPPDSFQKLLAWVMENPGRFTYPQPPDFTGSAFMRQVFYAVTGGHAQYLKRFDEKLFERNAEKLWDYLNEMKPYLWQKGQSYPKDVAGLDTLFERGEVDFNMSYHQTHAQNKIITEAYPKTVRTFVMTDGSIYNTHFVAIPFNAPNKAGAMVVANFLLSPEAQLSKNDPNNWGDFTVLDMERVPPAVKQSFMDLDLGDATVALDVLGRFGVPEIPSQYLELLERGWEENVLRK